MNSENMSRSQLDLVIHGAGDPFAPGHSCNKYPSCTDNHAPNENKHRNNVGPTSL